MHDFAWMRCLYCRTDAVTAVSCVCMCPCGMALDVAEMAANSPVYSLSQLVAILSNS